MDRGADAINFLRENPVDLIVSDFRMPEMDGVEFLSEARNIHQTAVRVLLTGYPDEHLAIKSLNLAHVDVFLVKPAGALALVNAVEEKLAAHRAKTARDLALARTLAMAARSLPDSPGEQRS